MAGTAKPNRARYGHIAALITAYLQREEISASELARRLDGSPSLASTWKQAKGAPSAAYRPKLAALLGVDLAELLPRDDKQRPLGPARQAVVLAKTQDVAVLPPAEPVRDVFSFVRRSDGQVAVRLQATLPGPQGMALARMLMDFDLIVGESE